MKKASSINKRNKVLYLLSILLVIGSGTWAGYIDTDGYYVMDSLELAAWNGATNQTASMAISGLNGTISGISSASNPWWLQFTRVNGSLLPGSLGGAAGWKLTYKNTSTAGSLKIILGVSTAANSWQTGPGITLNPGQTGTTYINITGPESMSNYYIIVAVPATYNVLTFTLSGLEDKAKPWSPNPKDDPAGASATVPPQTVMTWKTAMVKDPSERPNPNVRKHYLFANFSNPANTTLSYIGEINAGSPVAPTAQYPASGTLDLSPQTIYKWQIKEGLDNGQGGAYPYDSPTGLIEGPVWTFKTDYNKPVITKNPEYTSVFAAETAVMTAQFTSSGPITGCRWYWSGNNGTTFTELTNGSHPGSSGSAVAIAFNESAAPKTTTLTITASQPGIEGWYYCALTNAGGTAASQKAGIAVKRLVAYYPFENNLTDASVQNCSGTAKNAGGGAIDLGYGAGVSGNAVILNSNPSTPDQTYIELPAAGYPKAAPGGAMEAGTILFWYKSANSGTLMGSSNNTPDTTAFRISLNSQFEMSVNGTSNTPTAAKMNAALADNTWRFGAVRWQLGGQCRMYTGYLGRSGTSSPVITAAAMTPFTNLSNLMVIGAENYRGTLQGFLSNAMIDELQIYNYPLTDTQIGDMYTAISGQPLYVADVFIDVNAASPVRTIPMTMYGGNLTAWDGAQNGSNTTFNNLLIASGRKYLRWCGGSWGDSFLWRDMEGPNGAKTWIVSYTETLSLLTKLSQPGEEVVPTLQPIINFPGIWHDIQHTHQEAVNEAVAWVQDQTNRTPTAKYWEIGNETAGPWEAGWFDGISGTYYGDYFADFYLAMKAVNPTIKIGANVEPFDGPAQWGWYDGYWTRDTLTAAWAKGVVPDFLIIHQYPGNGSASGNPTLLKDSVNDIAVFTSNLDAVISDVLGPSYVGQIRYWMTEWDASGSDTYDRKKCYVNAMFHAQYLLEMCKYNWEGANAWAQWEYDSGYFVFPVWYIHPLMINFFGRNMVSASSSESLIRSYAAVDSEGNLTIFVINNSPTDAVTAQIKITDFLAAASGQQWLVEPAGNIISGGVNIQDMDNIKINGIVHPNPLAVGSLAPQSVPSGNDFAIQLPASGMVFLKIPQAGGDITPPSAPAGVTAAMKSLSTTLTWNTNSEPDLNGYIVYRSQTPGSGYTRLSAQLLTSPSYTDTGVVENTTYYYVITAIDTSLNESALSTEQSVSFPKTSVGFILRQWWTEITGTAVSNLTSNANYPNQPAGSVLASTLEGPTDWDDSYGTRFVGYLHPLTGGQYTFWIAGDDNCELWLSTNGNPANRVRIARVPGYTSSRQWDKYPTDQKSALITLTAGQKYYIEVLHKEGTGGDNIAVAWSGPGISRQVISGLYLSPYPVGIYGDFDKSGKIDLTDFSNLADDWMINDCFRTAGMDMDGNCQINIAELSQLAVNWLN